MENKEFICPECGTAKLLYYKMTSLFVNPEEYDVQKPTQGFLDNGSEVRCLYCYWEGTTKDLVFLTLKNERKLKLENLKKIESNR